MNKPKNYESTTAFGEWKPLELGGHICRIMKVEETKSSKGKDMINIFLDIEEGEQKGYYAEQYRNDKRTEKKWGCIVYQLIEDKDGNTAKGFKTFIDAVKKSNPGFNEDAIWNDKFCDYFKNKLVGGIFGREQYKNSKGEFKWSTKCTGLRSIETIREGVEIPADKYHKDYTNLDISPSASDNSDFEEIDDDDLPF